MEDKEVLASYRLRQAEETLLDAKKMLESSISPRSIVNRAYYSVFYAVLALFLKEDIMLKTSKHSGIISIFDKEFVHTKKIDKKYSKILHYLFELRQEGDYRELTHISIGDAIRSINLAEEFLKEIISFCKPNSMRKIQE